MVINILNKFNMKVAVYNSDTMKLIVPPRTNNATIHTPHKCVERATFAELITALQLLGVSPQFEDPTADPVLDNYYNYEQEAPGAVKKYTSYKS